MTDSDLQFLASYDASRFPRPSVAVDVAVITAAEGQLRALLVQRSAPPQAGRWGLPGGFLQLDEGLDAAAERVLAAKAGLRDVYLEQLYTFGAVDRDPRTRVISVAYVVLVPPSALAGLNGGTRVAPLQVPWAGETGGPVHALDDRTPLPLAFDHADILGVAVQRLRGKLDYSNVGFRMLPPAFTLRALQHLHETVLGRSLNKDSFRRRLRASGLVEATGERQRDVGHRPAALYRFTGATAPREGRH